MSDPTTGTATSDKPAPEDKAGPKEKGLDKQITLAIITFALLITICHMWTINRRCIAVVERSAAGSGRNKEVL